LAESSHPASVPDPISWHVRRTAIASVDAHRRLPVGRLSLDERRFVVAGWTPFLLLKPAALNHVIHPRVVDSTNRLQLRPADVEVLGDTELLVVLTTSGWLIVASARDFIERALRTASGQTEAP